MEIFKKMISIGAAAFLTLFLNNHVKMTPWEAGLIGFSIIWFFNQQSH
jgi:hypothetical protein